MGRLTGRSWGAKGGALISAADATEFYGRCNESHTERWKVDVVRFQGDGVVAVLATDVPIVGGRLVLDSSDPIRRRLTLDVGGGLDWAPTSETSPLAPFGQTVVLSVSIDRADGTFFPWLKVGEYPIRTTVVEHPSQITTVECTDYSGIVDEFLHLTKQSYTNRKLADVVTAMVSAALAEKVYAVEATPQARTTVVRSYVADAGQSRWETAVTISGKKGHEALFDWNGDLVIRRDLTDDDDDSWDPSDPAAVGPDIGTVSNPVATIRDGQGGNLVGLTTTLTRDGGCNLVQLNLSGLVPNPKRKKKTDAKEIQGTDYVRSEQKTGPTAWGDVFGHIPIVQSYNVHRIADVKASYQQHAHKLRQRRHGLVRYLDLDCLALYWLEPDDKVAIRWGAHAEAHFVQRIELDLAGGPMRVRTRQLSVSDPG